MYAGSMQPEASSPFDARAAAFDENPARVRLAAAVAGSLVRRIPFSSAMSVMDFGAGTGLVTLAVQPLVGAITAVDTSREMLKVLERKKAGRDCPNLTVRFTDIAAPDLGPFDAIFSSMTLHHVPDTAGFLRRCHALLRPDGWLAIADLDTESGTFHGDLPDVHHRGFDRDALAALFASCGFRAVTAEDVTRLEKPDAQGAVREYSVFLISARR